MSDMLRTALCDKGVSFVHFERTDSTNMRAREHVKQDETNIPALFLADTQTCGRGRLGRSFYSPDASGLYMTFLMKTSDSSELFSRITAIAAVCASDAVFECFGVRAKIKWVNDLYVSERKVAGILAESFVERDERYVALGIGINIFASDLPEEIKDKAAPLFSSRGGKAWKEKRDALALSLVEKLLDATKKNDFGDYIEKYREYSCVIGEHITFSYGGKEFFATATDITPSGALAVVTDDGEMRELSSGEISVVVNREGK